MPTVISKYGTEAQAISITLAALANNAVRESAFISNTADRFLDVEVMVRARNHATSVPTGDRAVYVYVWGTVDATLPLYPDAVTGADALITLHVPTHLKPLGSLVWPATAALTRTGGPWSIAAAFGGRMPQRWGIVVENKTGFDLDTTEANFRKEFQGQTVESV